MTKSLNGSALDRGNASVPATTPPSASAPLAFAAARQLTDTLKRYMGEIWERLLALYEGDAHTVLGYRSWHAYCDTEFGLGESHCYRLLDAARVRAVVPQLGNESHARQLMPLLREQGADAVYKLGPHRLICGDATDPEVIATLLADERAAMIWTDPPYGVDYVGKTKDALTIQNDSPDGVRDLLVAAWQAVAPVLIESAPFFMLATVDGEGRPDVSYKGGVPGFVRCVGDRALEFPTYDGNGQFRSLGNILVNPNVSLLFIDFETPNRLRIQGRADLGDDLTVHVDIDQIWPNCPRYIHRMRFESLSPHAPRDDYEPPDAEWKQYFTDVLPCTPPS